MRKLFRKSVTLILVGVIAGIMFAPAAAQASSGGSSADSAKVRRLVERAAKADRPGEVKRVEWVDVYPNSDCLGGWGAEVYVSYNSAPWYGFWFACKVTPASWNVTYGPIYHLMF